MSNTTKDKTNFEFQVTYVSAKEFLSGKGVEVKGIPVYSATKIVLSRNILSEETTNVSNITNITEPIIPVEERENEVIIQPEYGMLDVIFDFLKSKWVIIVAVIAPLSVSLIFIYRRLKKTGD